MNKNKVLYIGRTACAKIFKVCEDKAAALVYHFDMVRSSADIKSFATFPVIKPIVKIDRLSHMDVSNLIPQ